MRNLLLHSLSAILIALLVLCISNPARAEGLYSDFFRACSSYDSAAQFVQESSLYCLKQARPETCEREAKLYFKNCGFDGKYSRLSSSVFQKVLMMFVLGKASPLVSYNAKAKSSISE